MENTVKKEKNKKFSKTIEWILYFVSYTLVLGLVDLIFDSFTLDNIWYGALAVLIISVLNKTVKPVIFKLTIPITGLTFGLFYPFINLFILKIVDFMLQDHFDINGILIGVLIAALISVMNFIIEEVIINPIIRRCK